MSITPADAPVRPAYVKDADGNYYRIGGGGGGGLDQTTADNLYVNLDGDTMTGDLSFAPDAAVRVTDGGITGRLFTGWLDPFGSGTWLSSGDGRVGLYSSDRIRLAADNFIQIFSTKLDLNSSPIVNVGDPVNLQDAATKQYVDNAVSAGGGGGGGLDQATADARYVNITGDTMTGPLVIGTGGGSIYADAITKGITLNSNNGLVLNSNSSDVSIQAGGELNLTGYYINVLQNMDFQGVRKAMNMGAPVDPGDATTKQYVDTQRDTRVAKTGDTMAGNLNMGGWDITNARWIVGQTNIEVYNSAMNRGLLTHNNGVDIFSDKQINLNGTTINVMGNGVTTISGYPNVVVGGRLETIASNVNTAPLRIAHGTAPTTPVNGDVWTTTGGLYARISGATVGPFGAGGGGGDVMSTRKIDSGAGLTGGGDLTADRTLAVGAGTGITVAADSIAVDTTTIQSKSEKDTASGYAGLVAGKLAYAQLPTGTAANTVAIGNHIHAAADTTTGIFAIGRIPTGTTSTTVSLGDHLHTGIYQPIDTDLTTIAGLTATTDNIIQSVASTWASRTPAQFKSTLALVKADVGLGSVDNTADTAKPVSTAQQTALNLKADITYVDGRTPKIVAQSTQPADTSVIWIDTT